jgi:hypothetical protein
MWRFFGFIFFSIKVLENQTKKIFFLMNFHFFKRALFSIIYEQSQLIFI